MSDIHANATALTRVLEDAGQADAVWCLGDLVGYGPDPNECVEIVRALPNLLCLSGNHDHAVPGKIPLTRFNHDARMAIRWTQAVLTQENAAFLDSLQSKIILGEFTLTHGSPRQPVWEYILDSHSADQSFESFETDYCLVGHSHLPLIFHRLNHDTYALPKPIQWRTPMAMMPRMILNPGSVGQPRDMDPRASFAILDTEVQTWEARRAEYDIFDVQRRILEAGLPERQAVRLMSGW